MLLQIILSSLIFLNALATSAPAPPPPPSSRSLESLLDEAENEKEWFCANCLLWFRRPDLAEKYSNIELIFKGNFDPAKDLEYCSTRLRGWIVEEFVDILDAEESDFPGISTLRPAFLDNVQKFECSEDSYDENYGTPQSKAATAQRELLSHDWTPEELAQLHPETRKVIEQLLKARREADGEPPPEQSSSFVDGRDQSLVTNALSKLGVSAAFAWGAMASAGRFLQGAGRQVGA